MESEEHSFLKVESEEHGFLKVESEEHGFPQPECIFLPSLNASEKAENVRYFFLTCL